MEVTNTIPATTIKSECNYKTYFTLKFILQ